MDILLIMLSIYMHCNVYVYMCYTFLSAELKKLRSTTAGSGSSVHRELARTHHYTLQLERQLRYYLAKGAGRCVCVYVCYEV